MSPSDGYGKGKDPYANGGAFTSSAARLSNQHAHRRSIENQMGSPFDDDHETFDLGRHDSYRHSMRTPAFFRRSPFSYFIGLVVLATTFWLGQHYGSSPPPEYPHFSSSSSSSSSSFAPLSSQHSPTFSHLSGPRDAITFMNGTQWSRPAATKIIGIIFFGRRQFVDVLDCYLRRNLAINGGVLDEIHFLMHTDDEQDKAWLRDLVEKQDMGEYYKLKAEATDEGWNKWTSFQDLYKNFMTDPNTIYIKVDDDLLYIDDYAIPELIRTLLEHPEAHSVVANNINNRWNYWHHHRTNAIYPYLADRNLAAKWPVNSWCPSELPYFDGSLPPKMHNYSRDYGVPFSGHRWLPLQETESRAASISHTPWGPWLPNPMYHTRKESASWGVVAQAHYSFFENLERGQLNRYYFGNGEDYVWNLWYARWNINFFAITGANVAKKPFWGDEYSNVDKGDEYLLTMVIPKELDMPVLVATRSIVSHYSFRGDRVYLLETDVLDRYRAFANQQVCLPGNKKKRFGARMGPHHTLPIGASPPNDDADDRPVSGGDTHVGDGPADLFNPDRELKADADEAADHGDYGAPP